MTTLPVPRFETGPAMLLGGLRGVHHFATAEATVPAQWARFRALKPLPGLLNPGTVYGILCRPDPGKRMFEYLCACEVADLAALPAGLGRLRVPAARYAVFRHTDSLQTLAATWWAIWQQWYPTSGLHWAPTPDIERYGPEFDPATGQGGVEIWFPILAGAEAPALS
ncbi:GyrI-like domain-containing protein [Hymenobacter jeollabukensis]|uniref:GyrI-like domain-containing protein n=1 Tax=Hymenobacter jeollabukensis TaxID=2025313 RepID=A0A5R8WS44_9BACT|nr:GyrI-like domain-containing protein [Hymenobacter jeollabukensis]TLM94001.1 GyrI-like domain-containing protein [Hymenobacter jeollabukensis]